MKRFVLLLVVLAGGLAWAALAIPTDAAKVNGTSISQSQLNSDVTAIAGSPDYQCYLNAQEYADTNGQEELPPVNGAGQASGGGSHPTATTAFTSQYLGTEIGHQIISDQAAKRGLHITSKDIKTAKAQLADEITQTMSEVSEDLSVIRGCTAGTALTGPEVLATLPPSFVDSLAQFNATVGVLEETLSGDDTTAGLLKFYEANRSDFDTACFTVAGYSSQSAAQAALAKVDAGTPFSQVAAAVSGGGPQGCDVLYGIAAQLPSADLPALKIGEVSAPISANGSYLLVQITSRTPTSFAKAESSVREAAAQTGANEARALLDASEQHALIAVNPRYGTWVAAEAQILVPNVPPIPDTLNPLANEPAGTVTSATAPGGSSTPAHGTSG
ncbi:MAG: peptidyl-prolyl cis-trans isomerase [Acidimicrobiales bacterium]